MLRITPTYMEFMRAVSLYLKEKKYGVERRALCDHYETAASFHMYMF